MATNVAIDAIVDAIVAQLGQLVPATGGAVTMLQPVRTVQRYVGGEFTTVEGMKRGIAGRTPALRVRWAGSRKLTTTIGRRVDRVESLFAVIVVSDNHRSKDERNVIVALAETVRSLVGSRAFGLPITPTRWQSTNTLRDDDSLLALSVVFAVRHRVDYTVNPGTDVMLEYEGTVTNADPADTKPLHVDIDEVFP
jgi:hypothetical protein